MARNVRISKVPQQSGIRWVVLVLVLIGGLLAYTWCRAQYVLVGYEIDAARQQHHRLVSVQKELRVELERLKSPQRLAAIASKQLGLNHPHPDQVLSMP